MEELLEVLQGIHTELRAANAIHMMHFLEQHLPAEIGTSKEQSEYLSVVWDAADDFMRDTYGSLDYEF